MTNPINPFIRTQSGPPPLASAAPAGVVIGNWHSSVTSPTVAASGTVSAGGGGGVFLPGYLEYLGWSGADYLTNATRKQFAANTLG